MGWQQIINKCGEKERKSETRTNCEGEPGKVAILVGMLGRVYTRKNQVLI